MTVLGPPPLRTDPTTGQPYLEVPLTGPALLHEPLLNKGTAFTEEERDQLGLRGLLPPHVATMREQLARVAEQHAAKQTPLERYIHLTALMDRNETLFYRFLLEHLEALLPVVYTPTVGEACLHFSRIFRRSRGLYVTDRDCGRVAEVLANHPHPAVRLIVVTDGERILGLGDLGANGMGIPIGKLTLYVVAAGISPWEVLPVCLDVGTQNPALLEDPFYLGQRKERLRGEAYDALLDEFMAAVAERYPDCLVQFEDFAHQNSFRLLDRYRERYRVFNDDIQGTGAVALAGLLASERVTGRELLAERVVIVGAGSAGIGIARQLQAAMGEEAARERLWVLDSRGLITTARSGLERTPERRPFARTDRTLPDGASLLEVVEKVKPTVLVGVTGKGGLFAPPVLRALGRGCERPVVFALSNPTAKSECTPEQVARFTEGRGLAATGSPFPPFAYRGRRIRPGQANNVYIFPGVGLGVLASGARLLPPSLFLAAARALADTVTEAELAEGCLYPALPRIRAVSRRVALGVGRAAAEAGLAARTGRAFEEALAASMWEPSYLPYRPARSAS